MSTNRQSTRLLACLIWCGLLTSFGEAGTRWATTIGGPGVDEFISHQQTTDGGTVLPCYRARSSFFICCDQALIQLSNSLS